MPKITAIHGGGDWADASAEYLVVPPGVDIEKAKAERNKWHYEVYCPALSKRGKKPRYLSLKGWLIEKCGARETTADELEVIGDQD